MGKIRVKTIGDEEQEAKDKADQDRKRAEKLNREKSASGGKSREASSEETSEQTEAPAQSDSAVKTEDTEAPQSKAAEDKPAKKTKKAKFLKKVNKRSQNYSAKVMEIDKNKIYPLSDALELLRKVKIAKFDETVELHINTTEAGINGQVKLPHGTGKEIRIAIATDDVLLEVEKGKINFDVLIAEPSAMPKLARVARVLGPRGLMPNPKNGTISDKPEEAMKKFQGGQINFKTESKTPLIHLSVGKTSFEDTQLADNIKTIITAIKKDRIRKITLKSTMSPGIRLAV